MKLLQYTHNALFVSFWVAVFYTYGPTLITLGALYATLMTMGAVLVVLKVVNASLEATVHTMKSSSTTLDVTFETSKLWLAFLKPPSIK